MNCKRNYAIKRLFLLSACLLFLCAPALFIYPQEPSDEGSSDSPLHEDRSEEASDVNKRNIFADIGYSTLGVITSNVFLHLGSAYGDQPFARMTYGEVWDNILGKNWFWEEGDRFLVNNFGHPYQGSTYFASARINGFNFYESMLFVPLGSAMWELVFEPGPGINDFITTVTGGVALGEILHRLFLEVDSKQSIGATIGGSFVSPIGSFNKVYNRPARERGGGNIYALSVRTGIEKTFAFFSGHQEQADSWNYPGGYVDMNVVYGNPFVQQSATPYEHFEFFLGFTTNLDSYNAVIVSDGYLFSYNLVQTDTTYTSTGLSLHYDFFNVTNDLVDNVGYGNIQFSSSAVGWTIKHKYNISETSYLEAKAHTAFILWGNSMYNGDTINEDFWVNIGNNRNTYGMGGNVKLFFTFFHNKAGTVAVAAHGYYIYSIPVTAKHSSGNVFFLHSSISYEFPLGKKIGIGAKETFWGLFGLYNSAETVDRRLLSSCLYVRFTP